MLVGEAPPGRRTRLRGEQRGGEPRGLRSRGGNGPFGNSEGFRLFHSIFQTSVVTMCYS